ncbi:DNA-binding protein [Mycobacterium montefiorense]|uniref:DNA-binding protein n=2 Tax=Mycobacterium montefiorense TaxID=154654 RepID=A0AA37PLC2_9MYCO|nr:DNA-binding protein [Mycobacterium montefiorense]GKU36725.1 DNA-binding protein [Mycobacterium montefiorense]GKU42968.1 DNA-binding protein [Mycobacterium montefiorense]GKU48419.1 DNA-binding protein [Mycobacterium montefiorense]GKU50938.1 DNA-binding protein [Mycobacterium montefiorense]
MTTPIAGIPLSFVDKCKRIFLGKPLTTDQLDSERLSIPVALGALSPDAISSTAYGPEQIMIELLPAAGMAAFALLLPITGVILVILVLVSASYRQVVMTYTRSGGSYTVARENFGPRVAQVAASALLIDYVVTVAVQPAAATVAVVSAIPLLRPYHLEITLAAVALICLINLRGLRRSGRAFAMTTFAFVTMITVTIVTGFVREIIWGLPKYDPGHLAGAVPVHQGGGIVMGATVLIVLRAFANGGTSLTGLEAVSNTVDVFQKPEGVNARRVITLMACILGFLLAGVAWLAHVTHAVPYLDEYPSMLSEIAHAVFGNGMIGHILYFLLQASTAAILFTGCNTSFNGFPRLASFVAEDRFLPRPLTKRGHRLVFSNGILTLTALALTLLVITEAKVSALVPFYAIGVFTGFAMAGFGMAKHHLGHREPGWRRKVIVNLSAGVLSTIVVGIFAVAKFTEGAWLIVIVFPVLVLTLMRLNHKYRAEASVLEMSHGEDIDLTRHPRLQVLVFVDSVDLAEVEALRLGYGLHADELTAVHFVIDVDRAKRLRALWDRFEHDTPLWLINCPDRHLNRAAHDLVWRVLNDHPGSKVTVLLPRRTFSPLLGRLLHDRTADKMARAVSRIRGATAIIVPYDIESRIAASVPQSDSVAAMHTVT